MMDGHRGGSARGDEGADAASAPSFRRRRMAWNPGNWNPAPSSIGPNRGYRRPGSPGGRQFAPTEHLAPEAVAAFVDGELGMTAHMRATHHLALCPECVAAVDAQTSARARLRESGRVAIPDSLLSQLTQIPTREIDMTPRDTPTDRMGPDRMGRGLPPAAPITPGNPLTRGRMTRRWGR